MSLFKDKDPAEVVKPEDVIQQAGLQPDDLGLEEKDEPDEALEELIKTWIEQVESHIHVRLRYQFKDDTIGFKAIQGVITGNVNNVITYALQQRKSPIIQLGDYAVDIINASQVTKNLDEELEPFQDPNKRDEDSGAGKSRVNVFWSSQKWKGG